MIFANEVKPGSTIIFEGRVCIADSNVTSGTAQRRRSFTIKMHDMRTGQNFEKSFSETDKFEEPNMKRRECALSYKSGKNFVFMDNEDYTEYEISEDSLEKQKPFLRENETYRVLIIDEQPAGLELPPSMNFVVTETAPPTNQATGSSQLKEAVCENGIVVKVPGFVKTGDKLRVSTATHEYLGKA